MDFRQSSPPPPRGTKTLGSKAKSAQRILLYSHDSFGLGHFRRNLAIARAFVAESPETNVLLVSGSPCATQFNLPQRCDVVKLPSVGKDSAGRYIARHLSLPLDTVLELRCDLIMAAYRAFDPDVIFVDHQLTGLQGEALPMLRAARGDGRLTLFGMRDIVDSAEVVERDWGSEDCRRVLEQDYEHILVYGDRGVFDAVNEYPVLRPFSHKLSTVGYIANPLDRKAHRPIPTLDKHVLLTVGGGQDGGERIEAYLNALSIAAPNWKTHVVTGPLMDEAQVRSCKTLVDRSRHSESIRISRFREDMPRLIQQADAVVSMAGYNSCTEILQSRKPTVLLPRNQMRQEQRIRAERLTSMGLAQSIVQLEPAPLREAVERALSRQEKPTMTPDLNGLRNVCRIVGDMTGVRRDITWH